MNTSLRIISFLFFVFAASFSLYAGDSLPLNLGSGDPSLHIIYDATNQYIIYLNEPWTVEKGDMHNGGYSIDVERRSSRIRQIISCCGNVWERGWDPEELYPFDGQTAFTCPYGGEFTSDMKIYNYWPRKTQVFSFPEPPYPISPIKDNIMVSENVYALARARYGLTTNQLFLGKIGTNIFYWETQNPRKVYYHAVEQAQATYYFTLPRRVNDLYGVTKALLPKRDIGIWVSRKHTWWWMISQIMPTTTGYEDVVFEFSLTEARKAEGNK